jgi:hypothetical protein
MERRAVNGHCRSTQIYEHMWEWYSEKNFNVVAAHSSETPNPPTKLHDVTSQMNTINKRPVKT